jgi:hypothetical protein
MAKRSEDAMPVLAHPVYLDVPMMVSFLATMDDGVAYSSEVAEKLASSKEGEGEGGLKAGLPSLTQWLGLTLSAEGKYRRRSLKDETVEAKLVREHTSASLFNILRQRLAATGNIKVPAPNDDFDRLEVGDLVELRGTITGDPLRQIVALFSAIAPYLGIDLDSESPKDACKVPVARPAKKAAQSVNQNSTSGMDMDTVRMMRILKADVAKSMVLDLTMRLTDGRPAVLSASNEYMTEATEQYMLAGSFAALGKVTQVLAPGDRVSVLRRTVFGVLEATGAGPEEAFSNFAARCPA